MATYYDRLEMSWNIRWVGEENVVKALAAIEKYGGEELDGCVIGGTTTFKLIKFKDDETAHQCKLALENCNINAEFYSPPQINLKRYKR